ncbi:MAG: hypothetical protein LT071_06670 [Nocardioides sp.]|nr:hypothetical protein [Nocardioides sp.]
MNVIRTNRHRGAVAIGLALACAAALVLLVVQVVERADASDGGLDEPRARERVMSVTDQFVKRLGTYGPDMVDDSGQMPAYREQVREVITPKFAADFDEQVATAEQLVAQAGVTRSTDVFATGVSAIDDDSARVLVAGAFNDTYTRTGRKGGQPVTQEPYPFRFVVDLVLVDGEWLVDDFSGVNGSGGAPEQQGGQQ